MKNLLFGLLFAAVGIGVCCLAYVMMQKAKASTDWPSVQGKVTRSEVESRRETTGTGSNRKTKTKYRPVVHYTYTVDGREHSASRVSYGGVTSGRSGPAHRVVNRYPEGSAVTVYYDPAAPGTAVLEPGVTWSNYGLFLIGGVFALIGVFVMLSKSRSGRRSSRRANPTAPGAAAGETAESATDDPQQIEY